jgi:hypothetical protein
MDGMMNDLFNEFINYDVTMGADTVTCPHCKIEISCSLFIDDECECPECGKVVER